MLSGGCFMKVHDAWYQENLGFPSKSLWFNIDEYGWVISTHALMIFDAPFDL